MPLVSGSEFLVRNVILKAIKAAVPVGKPLSYQGPKCDLMWTDVPLDEDGSIQLHYIQTLAIHIHLERIGDDLWRLRSPTARPYMALQTWAREYPTWKSLFESIKGVKFHENRLPKTRALPTLHKLG
jgi:hypothetical protein